jgi:PhoH-like ATPase
MSNKIYCLDTNVLLSDPMAIYNFDEHQVYIPFIVLSELDSKKVGHTDLNRNAREATRQLEIIMQTEVSNNLYKINEAGGTLTFTTQDLKTSISGEMTNDDIIIAEVSKLSETIKDKQVILVSADINMRVKAKSLLLSVEAYKHNQVNIVDSDVVGLGYKLAHDHFSQNTIDRLVQVFHSSKDTITVPYTGDELEPFTINGYITVSDNVQFTVIDQDELKVTLAPVTQYNGRANVWGIRAKNAEQNVALNMLMDKNKHLVVIGGQAGSGKTIIALAAALEQVIEQKLYERIVFMRETVVAAGAEEIGFLPGTLDDKMIPYLGALTENLKQLTGFAEQPKTSKKQTTPEKITSPLGQFEDIIEINSIGLMRGTSIPNAIIIIDESQNLTKDMVKMLLTRAGEGTKIIMIGNMNQIDNVYLSKNNNGMAIVVDKFKDCDIFGYTILQQTVRSKLAEEAVNRLVG